MGTIFEPVNQPRFHRDFDNDLPKKTGNNESLVTRAVSAALPVLSLYRPFGRALSVGSNTSRLFCAGKELDVSLEKVGNLALSVAAVAGSVFYSHVGMMITTSHDILLGIKGVATSNQKLLEGVKLLNNVAYMTLMCCGSLELQIVSLATQILLNVASSANEYSKGRSFEAGMNLLMTGVRVKQMNGYVGLLKNRWKMEEAIRNNAAAVLKMGATMRNDAIAGFYKVTGWVAQWDPYEGDHLECIKYRLENDTCWSVSNVDLKNISPQKGATVKIVPVQKDESEYMEGKRYWMIGTKDGEPAKVAFHPGSSGKAFYSRWYDIQG